MKHWFSDLNEFRRDPLDFLLKKGSKATEAMERIYVDRYPVYLITDPSLVKTMMQASEEFIDKGRFVYKLRAIVGKSSLTISGEAHKKRRAAIHAQLARGIANSYVPQISALIRQQAAKYAQVSEFNAHQITAPLALRIICNALFGHGVLSTGDENALIHAIHLVEDDLAEGMFRLLPPAPWTWVRNKRNLNSAREIMDMVVARTRKRATASSLLHALEQLNLTDEEMRDELLMIILGGHHTTGTTAAWILYYLATRPDIAEALALEAISISDDAGEIRADALAKALVSRNLIREITRLYPAAWWFSREVKKETSLGGNSLQPGTSLMVSPWHMGRDPRYWDNPETLDLSRSTHNKAYIPWGLGPRTCVGMGFAIMELQLIALEFASAYRLEILSPVPALAPKPSVTLIPPEIRIKLAPKLKRAFVVAAE